MSKKSRKRREKHRAHEQIQQSDPQPPPANQNQEIIRPLILVKKYPAPDNGYIHPLERFEPIPLEEVYNHSSPDPSVNPPISIAPAASQPSVAAEYQTPFPKSLFKTDSPSDNSKFHDFSSLIKDAPVDSNDMLMQNRIAMCNAMTPHTPDGVLLDHMSVGEIARAKIPMFITPATPTPEHPIHPIAYAREFADGKLPDDLQYVDGFVSVEEGPNGKPVQVTTFADPVCNLSPQDRTALELGRKMQQSGNSAQQPFPKQEGVPFITENTGMSQHQEIGTVSDCPSKGCLTVTTNKGICRLTNFRIIPLEGRMILGKLEHEEPRLEYSFEILCGVMGQTITVGATELDSIVKVIQSKMPICTVTPTVLKASSLISNYVREQIMDLPQRIHVQRTGFMRFSGDWVYVHDGASPPDPSIVFNTGRFIPDDRLVTNVQAFHNAMGFLDICSKDELIIPLFLLAHLGPLFQLFLEAGKIPRFVTILTGRSGSLKTSLSLVLYRLFHDQGQTPTASFRDTETAMEIKLGELNSTVGIFDDFAPPAADQLRSKATREKLEALIRAVGDHVAKSRSNTQLGKAKEFIPSGSALVTSEDISGSQSSLLRCLILGISKGDINGAKLRQYQSAPDLIPTHMNRFLNWVGLNGDRILNLIRNEYHTHQFDGCVTELRLIDTAETLLMAARILTTYGVECGAMDYRSAQDFCQRCFNALCTAISASESMSKDANPCVMYLSAFFNLCERGEIKLAGDITLYIGEVHDGFLCDGCAWVDPHGTYAKIRQYHSRLNTLFPLSEKQLNVHLADAEVIAVSYENRDSGTKKLYTKKSSLPNRKRMMVLDIERAMSYLEENGNN